MHRVNRLLVSPCLRDGESSATQNKKQAVIALAAIASLSIIGGVAVVGITAVYDPTVGGYLAGITMSLLSLTTTVIPYIFLRATKDFHDWLIDLQVWSMAPVLICLNLFFHQSSIAISTSIVTLIGITMRVRGWQFYLLSGVVLNVFHSLINDFGEELPVLRSTFYDTQLLSIRIIMLCSTNICPLFLFSVGLRYIINQFVDRANQADAAIRMSMDVAEKLRQYDTEGVGVILTANQGKVDENLLDAFAAIQHNLQEYRPHIPDYVIAATNGSMSMGDENTSDDEGVFGQSVLFGPNSINRSATFSMMTVAESTLLNCEESMPPKAGPVVVVPSAPSPSSGGNTMLTFMKESDSTAPIHLGATQAEDPDGQTATAMDSGSSRHSISVRPFGKSANNDTKQLRTSQKRKSVSQREANDGDTSHGNVQITDVNSKKRQHFYGRATTVFVRFVSAACGSDGGGSGSIPKSSSTSAMYILSKCIEEASAHAKAQGGALQYMQGCGLMVSFNAASRVVSHESSACTFALNLKTSIDDMSEADVVMHASIVTSNVLSFFAGNKGQLMLTVLGGFMPHHASIHHYLSNTVRGSASCAIVHESVLPSIDMAFEHRLLGGISNPVMDGDACIAAFSQLLRAKSSIVEDGEWMYHAMIGGGGSTFEKLIDDLIKSSLQAGSLPPSNLTDTFKDVDESTDLVLSRCVADRFIRWACDEGEFVARIVPTVLW